MKRCNAAIGVVLMTGLLTGGCAKVPAPKPDEPQIPPGAVQEPEPVMQPPEKIQVPATTAQEPSSGGEQNQPARSITQMPPSAEKNVHEKSWLPVSGEKQLETPPPQPPSPPPAYSLTPSQLHCNANVPWASLSAWTGEEGRCRAGTAYTVIGELPDIAEGYIRTRMTLPGNSADAADGSSSGRQPIVNHRFEVPLCIVRKDVDRQVVMQAYADNGSQYGGECGFVILRLATEAMSSAFPAESWNFSAQHPSQPITTLQY